MRAGRNSRINLPYVIDNRAHRLADALNDLLRSDAVHALDVATAYFNVGGFDLLRDGLEELASFRILLAFQPGGADELGLQRSLRRDLESRTDSLPRRGSRDRSTNWEVR